VLVVLSALFLKGDTSLYAVMVGARIMTSLYIVIYIFLDIHKRKVTNLIMWLNSKESVPVLIAVLFVSLNILIG
jgi:hypothetical protein